MRRLPLQDTTLLRDLPTPPSPQLSTACMISRLKTVDVEDPCGNLDMEQGEHRRGRLPCELSVEPRVEP